MVQSRNIGLAIILSLITCGIYSLYWMYKLTEEVSLLSGDRSFSGGKALLLSIITFGIYTLFWDYQLGAKIAEAQKNKGITPKDNGVLYLVLGILGLGIISMAIAQSDVNNLV